MNVVELFVLAILAKFWVYATGLGPVAVDALTQFFSKPYRGWASAHGPLRRWTIFAIALGGILWASFAAFQDQYRATQTALAERNDALGSRGYWAGLAQSRKGAIERVSGYRDQIRQLNAKVTAQTPHFLSGPTFVLIEKPETAAEGNGIFNVFRRYKVNSVSVPRNLVITIPKSPLMVTFQPPLTHLGPIMIIPESGAPGGVRTDMGDSYRYVFQTPGGLYNIHYRVSDKDFEPAPIHYAFNQD